VATPRGMCARGVRVPSRTARAALGSAACYAARKHMHQLIPCFGGLQIEHSVGRGHTLPLVPLPAAAPKARQGSGWGGGLTAGQQAWATRHAQLRRPQARRRGGPRTGAAERGRCTARVALPIGDTGRLGALEIDDFAGEGGSGRLVARAAMAQERGPRAFPTPRVWSAALAAPDAQPAAAPRPCVRGAWTPAEAPGGKNWSKQSAQVCKKHGSVAGKVPRS